MNIQEKREELVKMAARLDELEKTFPVDDIQFTESDGFIFMKSVNTYEEFLEMKRRCPNPQKMQTYYMCDEDLCIQYEIAGQKVSFYIKKEKEKEKALKIIGNGKCKLVKEERTETEWDIECSI